MAGVGTNIAAVDYNAIRSAINPILDKVSTGYGQTPSSTTVSTAGIVTAAQWQALYADIAAVNFHLLNDVPTAGPGNGCWGSYDAGPNVILPTEGGGAPHNNMHPYLALAYIKKI